MNGIDKITQRITEQIDREIAEIQAKAKEQADAITACMSDYSRRVLGKEKTRRVPILEQFRKARELVRQQPRREQERVKEAVREDR